MRSLKFTIACIIISLHTYGQTTIQIILKDDGNHKIDHVDIFDISQKEYFEMPYNDTLTFIFNKPNIDLYNIRYYEKDDYFRQQIWLNSGQIKIEAHLDASNLKIDSIFNAPIYYEDLAFRQTYIDLKNKKDTTAMNHLLLESYSNNIDNPYSLSAAVKYINDNQNSKPNLLQLKTLTDKQGDRFDWFFLYPIVTDRLNSILSISSINLNDYTFINQQNEKKAISTSNKKYYILDFWFVACPPCVSDHKEIAKKLKTIDDKNAQLIGISIDDDTSKWAKYLVKNNYNWENYLENGAKKLYEDLGIATFPTYIIIDQLGNIVIRQNSFSGVLNWLDAKKE